jgi:hypothetical protein
MPENAQRTYCVDSSVFITLNRAYSDGLLPNEVWQLLDGMFDSGRVLSHEFVFAELCPNTTKPDFLAQWVKNKAKCFHSVTARQTELVRYILEKFPDLIDEKKEINQADPWLLALAIEKREGTDLMGDFSLLTVVSQESGKSGVKIPAACKQFGIPHLDLKGFIMDNGWKITLQS